MPIKRGRPKLRNPNTINITIKISPAIRQELDRYCADHDITIGEALRQGFELLLKKEKKDERK